MITTFKSYLVSFAFFVSGMLLAAQDSQEIQITKRSNGKSIQVQPIKLKGELFTFFFKSQERTLNLSELSDASIVALKEALDKQATQKTEAFSSINEAISHPLFLNQSLWTEQSQDIAERIQWPVESIKKDSASFRLYPPADYSFLGTRPYCATLYSGQGGTPIRFSLIFANKGDYNTTAGFGESHFDNKKTKNTDTRSLQQAIEQDAKTITARLTKYLGQEPAKQYYGEKTEKRKVSRWDVKDHSFLLTSKENEYTSLLIVQRSNAELEGKVAFIKDSELKKKLIKNVSSEDNGDIVIQNIPMVNQGPKGYCAPATFERAMNYMSIPADMYELATAATSAKGGTNTRLLADNCKRIIRSKARRIKELELQKDLEIRKIKKFIDKGVPILWQMRSLPAYNKLVNKRSQERLEIEDFGSWANTISAEAEELTSLFKADESNHHICMIIGYNKITQEIAVSDSWGPKYELRWVHIDIAKAVSSRGGFAIDF